MPRLYGGTKVPPVCGPSPLPTADTWAHGGGMTLALPALAAVLPTHERWFVESQQAGDWSFFFSPLPLVLTGAVVAVAILWRVLALRVDRPELPFLAPLGRLVPWIPRVLGIHLGVALLALAATSEFMTPANDDLHGVGGSALLLVEAALGIWLVTGINLCPAAGFVRRPVRRSPWSPARRRWASARTSPRSRPSSSSYLPDPTPTAPSARRRPSCAWRCCCCASASARR